MKTKLIKAYIKENLRIIALVIMIMTISSAGAFSVMEAQFSENVNYLNFQKKYLSLYGASGFNLTKDEVEKLKKDKEIENIYESLYLENFVDNRDGKIIPLEGYSKKSLLESKMKIVEGRYPKKENEALVFNLADNYGVGEIIPGRYFYTEEKDGVKNTVMKSEKIKIVGKVDNKLARHILKEAIYLNIDEDKIPINQRKYKVIINYKSGIKNAEKNTVELVNRLGIGVGKIYYNKEIANVSQETTSKKLDNPRIRNLIIFGIIFSLSTLIIYSKKSIQNMKLLRVVGASKKQVLEILSGESLLIGIVSIILGNIIGIIITKILVNNVNYTIAENSMYKDFDKIIHYDIYFTLCTVAIVLIPVVISLIYEVIEVNRGFVNREYNGKLKDLYNTLIGFSFRRNKKAIDKISSSNFRRNIIYLIVPVIIMSTAVSSLSNLKRAYSDESWKNITMALTPYMDRDYMLSREDKFIPEFGFSENDINKIRHMKGVKNVIGITESSGYYITKGNEFTNDYTNNLENGKEYPFSILVLDKSEMSEQGLLYDEIGKEKSDLKYPQIYLNDKFYRKDTSEYKDIYKKYMVGKIIKIKIEVKNGDSIEYKIVPVQVAGLVDNVKKIKKIFTPMRISGAYVDPKEFGKITNYIRYSKINFSSDKNNKEVKSDIKKIFGKSATLSYVEDTKDESSKKTLVFTETYSILIYACAVSLFSIISSLRIILSSRKEEDVILRAIGASKKDIKKMYLKEGIKFGIISAIGMVGMTLYDAIQEYLFLAEVFPEQKLIINYGTIAWLSFVPFIVFFIAYIVGTASFNVAKYKAQY